MKKIMKKTAAVALTGIMAAGLLSGCGKEEALDGTAVVATVDGEDITMGLLSLRTRQVQAQVTEMYASYLGTTENIWNQEMDAETGETYGEQTVKDCLNQTEQMYILRTKAAEYGVEVTEEDKEKIAAAAADFMAANDEETIAALAVTEEDVKEFLELETYAQRMYYAIIADVDTEVSDEEAQKSSFMYLNVATADLTEEQLTAEKELLQGILDDVKADPDADLKTIANEVNEDYSVLTGTFTTNAWEEDTVYPQEVYQALAELEDGEVCEEIIETEADGLYIVVMDQVFDEEETEAQKQSIITQRENDLYTTTTDQWMSEAEITVDEKVLETLKLKDNHKFSYKVPEESASTDELVVEEDLDTAEELADEGEVIEDEIVEEEASGEIDENAELFVDEEMEDEELVEVTDAEMEALDELAAESAE